MVYAIEIATLGYAAIISINFVLGLVQLWKKAGTQPASHTQPQSAPPAPIAPDEELDSMVDAVFSAPLFIQPDQAEPIAPPTLLEKLQQDHPLSESEVQALARESGLKGWQFYRKPETLRLKLCPAV
jgi:hypothetical protein